MAASDDKAKTCRKRQGSDLNEMAQMTVTGMTRQMGFEGKNDLGLKPEKKGEKRKKKQSKRKIKYQKLKFEFQTKINLLPNQNLCTCPLTCISSCKLFTGFKRS